MVNVTVAFQVLQTISQNGEKLKPDFQIIPFLALTRHQFQI